MAGETNVVRITTLTQEKETTTVTACFISLLVQVYLPKGSQVAQAAFFLNDDNLFSLDN